MTGRSLALADVPVAVLVGGRGTRLQSLTEGMPKALIDVAGRPFIDHQLDLLSRKGIRRVVLCTGYRGEKIAAHVGDGARFGLRVVSSRDGDQLLGTGGAIRKAAPLLGELFAVLYGDAYLDIDYRAVCDFFQSRTETGVMTVFRNENRWDTSNVQYEGGRVLRYDKRHPTPDMAYIDYGLGFFRRAALDWLPEGTSADLADLYRRLVEAGDLIGYEVHTRFYEIGSPAGLEETRRYLSNPH